MDPRSTTDSPLHSLLRVSVNAPAGLEELPGVRDEIAAALADAASVEVVVGTGAISLPLVQLICAAHRTAAAGEREMRVAWQNPDSDYELLQRTGFTRHTACPRSVTGDCLWLEERWR